MMPWVLARGLVSRAEVIAAARTWLKTPYHPQASLLGMGCDCVGLLRGVMWGLRVAPTDPQLWEGAHAYEGYSAFPDGVMLKEVCDKYLRPIPLDAAQPGDAVLLKFARFPQHLGILSELRHGHPYIIHASNDIRHMRVVESRVIFGAKCRLIAAYSFPGVD